MELPHWANYDVLVSQGQTIVNEFITNYEIQQLLNSNNSFDLIITETFVLQECTAIFGHVFKAPIIAIQSSAISKTLSRTMGNSLSFSYIPDFILSFPSKMSFVDRALNTAFSLRGMWYVHEYKYMANTGMSLRKRFPDAPPLSVLMENVAMVFANDHQTADYSQPRTPNIIPVAGIHIAQQKPLSKVGVVGW